MRIEIAGQLVGVRKGSGSKRLRLVAGSLKNIREVCEGFCGRSHVVRPTEAQFNGARQQILACSPMQRTFEPEGFLFARRGDLKGRGDVVTDLVGLVSPQGNFAELTYASARLNGVSEPSRDPCNSKRTIR